MASASLRFLTRSSGAAAAPTTTLYNTALPHHSSSGARLRRTHLLPSRQHALGSRRYHSLGGLLCTTTPLTAKSHRTFLTTTTRLNTCSTTRGTGGLTCRAITTSQVRFASNETRKEAQKLDESTNKPTPTPPTKPSILSQAIASSPLPQTIHENIYTVPNLLTFSRLVAAPVIGYFILTSQPVAALALFTYAGLTDLIDGTIARHFNSATVVGTIIDPMADKTLMTIVIVCLTLQSQIPVWLAVIILGRDIGLAISATYYRYISLPPPKTMARYWDFSLPSAEVRPTEISKINTLLQLLLVGDAMVLPVLPTEIVEAWNLVGVFEGWMGLVAATTVWSGLSYVFTKDAVKILSPQEGIRREREMKEMKKARELERERGGDV